MTITACVDSGAVRTFLPLEIAHRLGIAAAGLAQDARGGVGIEGVGFPTWSARIPIRRQVAALIGPGDVSRVWGPTFGLNPAFSEKEPMLLGRSDFFQAFTITFVEHARNPVFHLDYG